MGGPGSGRTKKASEEITIDQGLEILKQLRESLQGKKDLAYKTRVLADPPNIKTMTRLSGGEISFSSLAYWIVTVKPWGSMFNGLQRLAKERAEFNISKGGDGRREVIEFTGTIQASQLAKRVGIQISEPGEAKE